MKSIQLTGSALEAARSIVKITEDTTKECRALQEQVEAAQQELQRNANVAVNALLKALILAAGLDLEATDRPALDMRYLAEHNIAFLIYSEEDGEEDNGTHPFAGNGSDQVH